MVSRHAVKLDEAVVVLVFFRSRHFLSQRSPRIPRYLLHWTGALFVARSWGYEFASLEKACSSEAGAT